MTDVRNKDTAPNNFAKFAAENGCKYRDLIITVPNPDASIRLVGKTSPTTLRGKRWCELMKCDGMTIGQYIDQAKAIVPGSISRNNPEIATDRGLITVTAPVKAETKTPDASSKPTKAKAKKTPDLPALASDAETKAA